LVPFFQEKGTVKHFKDEINKKIEIEISKVKEKTPLIFVLLS